MCSDREEWAAEAKNWLMPVPEPGAVTVWAWLHGEGPLWRNDPSVRERPAEVMGAHIRAMHPCFPWPQFVFLLLSLFSEAGFLYVALAVLELTIDQTGLKLTVILLSLPPKCWD